MEISMNLRECYDILNEDYNSVSERLGSDNIIYKFLKKYIDRNDYEHLDLAVKEKNWKEAFIIAHNMKGFCLNMSFGALAESSSELCEALRDKDEPEQDIESMLLKIKELYLRMEDAVRNLDIM